MRYFFALFLAITVFFLMIFRYILRIWNHGINSFGPIPKENCQKKYPYNIIHLFALILALIIAIIIFIYIFRKG